MAFQINGYIQVASKNKRVCDYYINFLRINGINVHPIYSNYLDNNNSINKAIANQYFDKNEANKLVEAMLISEKESLLSEDKFNWLEKNQRACWWLWLKLRYLETKEIQNTYEPYREQSLYAYENFLPNNFPLNNKDRYESVIRFFDNWPANRDTKERVLQQYASTWCDIYNSPLPMSWLDKDNIEQCSWAWEYISKYNNNIFISPMDDSDKYLMIYAIIDSWVMHVDTKTLLLMKFKKAWEQKSYRGKHANDAKINYYINKKTKIKLEKLSKLYNVNNAKLIEKLVEDEYERKSLISITK